MDNTIRVMIAEDNEVLRSSLATFFELSAGLDVVGEASNGKEAIELCDQLHPDVIIMDMLMPEMDGLEATKVITNHYPDIQVIVLTTGFGWLAEDTFAAGASAYLLKTISVDKIVEVIHATYARYRLSRLQ
jgi:two-component system, NarL family, response regulator LiaR